MAESAIYEGRMEAPSHGPARLARRTARAGFSPHLPSPALVLLGAGGHLVRMVHRHSLTRALGGVLAVVLLAWSLAGCGDEPPTQEFYVEPSIPENPIAQTQAAAAEVADREALPPTSPILPLGTPELSGQVTVTPAGDGLEIEIEVAGLAETVEYAAHVHRGVCAEGGPVAAALSPVEGRMDGSGVSQTTVPAASLPVTVPLFVQIHGATGAPIACGDLMGQ